MEKGMWPKNHCAGFWMRYASVTKGQKMKVPSSMYSTSGKGWVGEPELQAEIRTANRTVNITGTLRASKCTRFTSNKTAFTDNMCVKCTAVERTNSFQYALGSRNAQEPSYIDGYDQKSNTKFLARDQLEHKADTMAKKLNMAEVEVTRLRQPPPPPPPLPSPPPPLVATVATLRLTPN